MTTRRQGTLRGASLAICVCLLAQPLALSLHVLVEDHCRVIDDPGARPAGLTTASIDHRHCDRHDHDHYHGHDHGHPHPDSAGSAHDPECGDGGGSHCPHPVEEHLVEMKGQPARSPSVVSFPVTLFAVAPAPSLTEAPPRIRREHRIEPSPPKPPPLRPAHPRAPPVSRAVLPA
jgi:hypothetical protein